jgi:hypothetical protein
MQSVITLSHVARNNLQAFKLVATGLDNSDTSIRFTTLQAVSRMKHGPTVVNKIVKLLKTDAPYIRSAAMEALTTLVDDSNEELITEAISSQRYHEDASVRRAVEIAMNKLQNKKKP